MKTFDWCSAPYAPLRQRERYYEPYICRLAPADRSFTLQWLDNGSDGAHTLYYRLRGSEDEWVAVPLTSKTVTITGITNLVDYELYIERDDKSGRSRTRLVSPCDAPGVVVNYIHPDDKYYDFAGNFLYNPNVIKLPSGDYLATHDVFGRSDFCISFVFISRDKGKTWEYQCELYPICECKPFVLGDRLYLVGRLTLEQIVISESRDEGKTWSEPVTLLRTDKYFEGVKRSGIVLHSTPITVHNGRIFFSFESGAFAVTNGDSFVSSMMSAPVNANLLDKNSWEYVPFTKVALDKIHIPNVKYDYILSIEGNPLVGHDGELYNLIRMDHMIAEDICNSDFSVPNNMAALYKFRSLDEPFEFVSTVDVAVGLRNMFFTCYDERTGNYFVLGNECKEGNGNRRCVYTLSVSGDLRTWRKLKELINCTDKPLGYCVSQPACFIDGDDLCYVSRTAWGNVKSQHDNNMATFHREKNFRNLL